MIWGYFIFAWTDYDGVEKGERLAVLFQKLDREVVPGEVLVHFQVHLSSTSSIYNQERCVPTISMNRIYLLL